MDGKKLLRAAKALTEGDEGRRLRRAHAKHSKVFMRYYGFGLAGMIFCGAVAYTLGNNSKRE